MSDRVVAALYCRASVAVLGDTTKVEDQEQQCRDVAQRRGWAVGEVYVDNNRSAWQRNRKRPRWDAMLAAVAAGRFGAIVSYWGDRIVRQPRDLEDLLDLRDVRHITLASVAGHYDFDNPDHRMMMRWEVARACNESDTISRRVTNHHAKRRRAGLVRHGGRGGRAYGFETDGMTLIPAEIAYLREAAGRILAGEPTRSIERDISARGARTSTGVEFRDGALRKMLSRPRYGGLMPDGVHAAAWPAVLDPATWHAVRAALERKGAAYPRVSNARRYLLSGIALCGVCGSGLQLRITGRRTHDDGAVCYRGTCTLGHVWQQLPKLSGYGCVNPGCGKVQRSIALLDAYVAGRVVGRLANPANPPAAQLGDTAAAVELGQLATQRAETEAQIEDYRQSADRVSLLMRRLDALDARTAELRAMADTDARARLLAAHAGISKAEFDALPLATRRALVSACYTIEVLPAGKHGPGFRAEYVRVTPR